MSIRSRCVQSVLHGIGPAIAGLLLCLLNALECRAGGLPHPHRPADTADSSVIAASIDPVRLAVVAAGTGAIITLAHLQNYNAWWQGDIGRFHLGEEGGMHLHHDKLGHWYFTYLAGDIIGRSLVWSGVEQEDARWYGGGIALVYQTYVEIEDGHHPELGFSLGDAAANLLGAAYPFFAREKPFSSIHPKWSVYPSQSYRAGGHRTIVDDYESQYFWLSMNLEDVLGETAPQWLPSWLNVAVGTGVKGLDGRGGGHREWFLGLDVDAEKLPGEGSFLSAVKHALNYLHVPAPALRLGPDAAVFLIRF